MVRVLQTKRADGVLETPPPALTPGKESTMPKATSVYNLSGLMLRSWAMAKHRAKHHGGSVRSHLSQAMRECWALAKKSAADLLASRARVQAAVEAIKASHTAEATAQRAADMTAFNAKFFPARRSYGRAWR